MPVVHGSPGPGRGAVAVADGRRPTPLDPYPEPRVEVEDGDEKAYLAVFARARWAGLVGITVSLVAAVISFFGIFVHPLANAIIVTHNFLIAYALTMYGLDEESTARS
jgi:hypothetical protein